MSCSWLVLLNRRSSGKSVSRSNAPGTGIVSTRTRVRRSHAGTFGVTTTAGRSRRSTRRSAMADFVIATARTSQGSITTRV